MKNSVRIMAAVFLVLLFGLSWKNHQLTKDALREGIAKDGGLRSVVESVQTAYQGSDFYKKNDFINISGGFARVMGRQVVNKTVRLGNGHLNPQNDAVPDWEQKAELVTELHDWLEAQDIPMLYVQMPYKVDLQEELLPVGLENGVNEANTQLVNRLREASVQVLDLREYLSADGAQVTENFYVTDHHWTPVAAFRGFQYIAEAVQELFTEKEVLGWEVLDENQWELHAKENGFLGSRGRRVGQWYVGMDDLLWLEPKFETSMSTAVPVYQRFDSGSYVDAVIQEEYLGDVSGIVVDGKPGTYFNTNQFCVYIGGDYPQVVHRNADAPVDMRVLIIKDSFMLPCQTFLATLFTHVETLDVRYAEDPRIAESIIKSDPDLVIYAQSVGKPVDNYAESFSELGNMQQVFQGDLQLQIPEGSTEGYRMALDGRAGTFYECAYEAAVGMAENCGLYFALVDRASGRVLDACIADPVRASREVQRLRIPIGFEGEVDLMIYPDMPMYERGGSVLLKNLSIKKS